MTSMIYSILSHAVHADSSIEKCVK